MTLEVICSKLLLKTKLIYIMQTKALSGHVWNIFTDRHSTSALGSKFNHPHNENVFPCLYFDFPIL